MNTQNVRRRVRGFTLIEVLTVVAVLSMLLSLVAVSLATLLQVGQNSAERLAWQSTWHRLTLEFRADAHAAREATVLGDAANALQLKSVGDTTIVYEIENNAVKRTAKRDDAIVASEFYLLPEETRAVISLTDGPYGRLATIALGKRGDGDHEHAFTRPLSVEAYVGLDQRRFAAMAEAAP